MSEIFGPPLDDCRVGISPTERHMSIFWAHRSGVQPPSHESVSLALFFFRDRSVLDYLHRSLFQKYALTFIPHCFPSSHFGVMSAIALQNVIQPDTSHQDQQGYVGWQHHPTDLPHPNPIPASARVCDDLLTSLRPRLLVCSAARDRF